MPHPVECAPLAESHADCDELLAQPALAWTSSVRSPRIIGRCLAPTAIIVPFDAADRAVARWRRAHTTDGAEGLPAHVTLIHPFVDDAEFDANHVRELRAILRSFGPFDVCFPTLARFDGEPSVLYLEPDPAQPFLDIVTAIAASFPAYSPFSVYDPLVPHLTVAQTSDAQVMHDAEAEVAAFLPIATRASEVHVLEYLEADGWGKLHRIHL